MENVALRRAGPADLEWINERYRAIDFRLSAAGDFQVVAEVAGTPAGLGRIVPLEGRVGELGGMVVFEGFRGAGVARRIIDALLETADYDYLYCLPFANLEGLYASFGFRQVEAGAGVPAKVIEKFRWCQEFYDEPVLLMGFSRRGPGADRC
jgi:N-acetylglutamate synthase-like GNAT family acetyltransferase